MEPYKKNFRMYSYITSELVEVVNANFPGNLFIFSLLNKSKPNSF